MKPWTEFSVGKPSSHPKWTNSDCQPLSEVAHVAHVPVAVRIAEDRRLRADLVFDESKLNKQRLRVAWLSPNDWAGAGGFRYGNIRFTFDWARLVAERNAYWVESIAYGIPACRILLSEKDHGSHLDTYDPMAGDGPWWIDSNGTHYWNGDFCLEVMIEGDLALEHCTKVDFVAHHLHRCNIDPARCSYRGWDASKAGAEFIARVASTSAATTTLPGLTMLIDGALGPAWGVSAAISVLSSRIAKIQCTRHGTLQATDASAPAMARALLRSIADDSLIDDRAALAEQFQSLDDASVAAKLVIAEFLGLPDAAALKLDS